MKTDKSDDIYAYAVKAGARYPELVVAQWKLESGGGRYFSGKNNPFGLKGIGTVVTTTEVLDGKSISIKDSFIDFESQEQAVQYLVERWYKDYGGYKGVNSQNSIEGAARMLQSENYATDPHYADKLINIMSENTSQSQYADLVNAAESYTGLAHQKNAYETLQNSLSTAQRDLFTKAWRSAPSRPKFPLAVPYFAQNDSKTGQGQRMCQSSAIAMRIEQIDPKLIGDDDSYLAIVNRYGDTVSQSAHQKALESLGLKASFRQNGTESYLCKLLDEGIAVPVGVLHKGPISNPTGGGHWITLIGYDSTHFWVHDPWGEMNVVAGGYVTNAVGSGKAIRYTRKNLMKRWLIASSSDGWLWEIRR